MTTTTQSGVDERALKPCPFCGSEARFGKCATHEENYDAGAEYVECTTCGAATALVFPCMDEVKSLLVERWNRRASEVSAAPATPPEPPVANWPLAMKERIYAVLQYYGNVCTYQGDRTGGVLKGCPRGPEPTPDELVYEALAMLRQIEALRAAAPVSPTLSPPHIWVMAKAVLQQCAAIHPREEIDIQAVEAIARHIESLGRLAAARGQP